MWKITNNRGMMPARTMCQWTLSLVVALILPDIVGAQSSKLTTAQIAGIVAGVVAFLIIVSMAVCCCVWCFCCNNNMAMAPGGGMGSPDAELGRPPQMDRHTFAGTGYNGSMYTGGGVDPTLPTDIQRLENAMQLQGHASSAAPYSYRYPPIHDRESYRIGPNRAITRQYVSRLPGHTVDSHRVHSIPGYENNRVSGYDVGRDYSAGRDYSSIGYR